MLYSRYHVLHWQGFISQTPTNTAMQPLAVTQSPFCQAIRPTHPCIEVGAGAGRCHLLGLGTGLQQDWGGIGGRRGEERPTTILDQPLHCMPLQAL